MATNQHYLVKQLSITNTDRQTQAEMSEELSELQHSLPSQDQDLPREEAAPASAGFYLRLAPENDFVQDSTLNEKIYLS